MNNHVQLGKPWLTFLSLYAEGMNPPKRPKYLTPELLRAAEWRFGC